MGKARRQGVEALDDRRHASADGREVVTLQVDLARGLLQQAQRVGLVAQPQPRRILRRCGDRRRRIGAEGGQGDPVEDVEPQLPVIVAAQKVVAEQVRIGRHDHATGAVGDRREQGGVRRLRGAAACGAAARRVQR